MPAGTGLKKSGDAHVLSIIVVALTSLAAAINAFTSGISKVWEPGASMKIALMFGWNKVLMS